MRKEFCWRPSSTALKSVNKSLVLSLDCLLDQKFIHLDFEFSLDLLESLFSEGLHSDISKFDELPEDEKE